MTKTVGFRVDDDHLQLLEEIEKRLGISRSLLIKRAIKFYYSACFAFAEIAFHEQPYAVSEVAIDLSKAIWHLERIQGCFPNSGKVDEEE